MSLSYMPKSKSDVHITPDRVWSLIKGEWNYDEKDFLIHVQLMKNLMG